MAQQNNWRLYVSGFLPYSAHLFILLMLLVYVDSDVQADNYEATNATLRIADSSINANQEFAHLLPGRTIKQEIASGKLNLYQITLSSGQFVHIIFYGQDRHFTIGLLTPSHRKILEFNSLRLRPSSLSFIADSSGSYILEVKFLEADEVAAHYELTLDQVRKPIAQDRDLIAADRASAAAEKLRAEWDSKFLLQSI